MIPAPRYMDVPSAEVPASAGMTNCSSLGIKGEGLHPP